LSGTAPIQAPATPAAPAATDTAVPDSSSDDLDFGSEEPTQDTSSEKPFDDEPFDAGVEANEDTDPKKFIEQLTGKLGQSLRKYTEEQGQADFELEKFAINSLLAASHTGQMDSEDQKNIIKKVKTSGKDSDESMTDLEDNEENDDTNDSEDYDTNDNEDAGNDTETNDGSDDDNLFETDDQSLNEIDLRDWKAEILVNLYDNNVDVQTILTNLTAYGTNKINRKRFMYDLQHDYTNDEILDLVKTLIQTLEKEGKEVPEELSSIFKPYNPLGESLFLETPPKNNMFQDGSNDILGEACWKGYKKDGMKTMFGKKYPNCVKVSENEVIEEGYGNILEETEDYVKYEVIEEGKKKKKKTKKDACYYKVKSRYDVWPSAYACVPENTSKALTRHGWKYVDELNVGDEIMTYNIEKDELEFKPILNLHRYKDVKTNVVRSGNNGFIFEATDNHKWVVKLPDIKGNRLQKYNRINDKALIETSDLLINKSNKSLVVSAPYNGGNNVKLDEIFKSGTNWVKYILDITNEQRQAWLFSAIVYDGNQQKVERLTENINNINDLNWLYTGPHGKQSFGFKQKNIEHRDAFLLSAFLNSGLVTWKKDKDKDIYSCHYSSNKPLKNTSNFKLVKENISDVWCPETENGTWVMMQETDGRGIITITGNSGALVKCRNVGAANWGNSTDKSVEVTEELMRLKEKWSEKYKKNIDCNNPKGFSQKAHCQGKKKNG